ncbi:MAG: LysR family transcriptional regulator [Pseudomonadota bacterium]
MDTSDLQTLIALADEKSFHGAANRLGLTQPAITRRLQRLEDRIGTLLFDRTTKPLQPTLAGQRALAEARDLLRRLDGFGDVITGATTPTGPVRFGISHGVAPLVSAPELRKLHDRFPDIALSIRSGWSSELLPLLRRGEIDALLALDPPNGGATAAAMIPAFRLDHVLDDDIVVIGPASDPTPPRDVTELARHPLILMPDGCLFRAKGNALAQRHGVRFASVLEVSALELQIDMIAAGAGYGIMARRYCLHSPTRDRIRILDLPGARWPMAISMIRRPAAGEIDAVIDALATIVIEAGNCKNAQKLSA